ncbi:hypothetical protein F5884DRAFT_273997 [Xylogone sp. PMI_703]|nr:hypothetical protein F5884DRAFT_273997 [Xylogone sp. PMI_703]
MSAASTRVLVTGGSGFVASYLTLRLLERGYTVRSTIRSLSRQDSIRKILSGAGAKNIDRLSFHEADLTKDDGWAEAIKGCTYVQHVASPLPVNQPRDENDVIIPAREGTLRVLRAARDAGVKRLVLTSSFAAIGYGHGQREEPFTEKDWTIPDENAGLNAYLKSKYFAEKAAWDFIEKEGGSLEMAVINPVGILGPVLSPSIPSSVGMLKKMMDGSTPGAPRISYPVVDVRDLPDLYISAMTEPAAKNERFLAVNDEGSVSLLEMANILREKMPDHAKKVPTREIPDWLIRVVSMFVPMAKSMLPSLGVIRKTDNTKSKTVLNWKPRPLEETLVDTADSLVKYGAV